MALERKKELFQKLFLIGGQLYFTLNVCKVCPQGHRYVSQHIKLEFQRGTLIDSLQTIVILF